MRHFRTLFRHELRMLFISPSTYVAGVIFLCLMGGIYWLALRESTTGTQTMLPAEVYFFLFWVPLFIIVPLITMRSFAEERRAGTLGALLTTPTSALSIVLGKFAAAYFLYIFLWALALAFPLIAWCLLKGIYPDERLLSASTLAGGSTFVALSGMLYISVGLLASSLTRSMLVAGLLTSCALFILVVGGGLVQMLPIESYESLAWLRAPAEYLHAFKHLQNFYSGLIDTRPFFLFFSGTVLALGLTTINVESKA